jgi:hypothetical protein
MSGNDGLRAAVLPAAAQRPPSCLQAAVISPDAVVGVLPGSMPRRGEQPVRHEHDREGRRLVGDGFSGCDVRGGDSLLEEPPGRDGITTRGDEDVDDLAGLADGAGGVAPLPGDLYLGLVDLPARPDGVPAGPGSVWQRRPAVA